MKGFYIQTFGCQMNVADSEQMKSILASLGYEEVLSAPEADLVLINTCSIREKPEEKVHVFAKEYNALKNKKENLLIGITGCVAQQEKEKIIEALPFVDFVLGPDNIDELPWAIEQLLSDPEKKIVRTEFDSEPRVWNSQTRILKPGPTAFISVMKGCDHFCSYCVVPLTRGREKSRPISEILEDVNNLVSRGVKEVTYLGQNINTFGKRADETLEELFRRTHDIKGIHRIRFTTSHPGDLKDELIKCFEDLPKLCSYFHLPVQSGSNRVLRAMRRFYTVEQYMDRVTALKQARADIAISTDIIVGFPGEEEEDFLQTVEVAKKVKYENAYSFLFSPRPGTAAAQRVDLTPYDVKMKRLQTLQEQLRKDSREIHMAELGKIKEILIEGPSKKNPLKFTGRTSQNIPVHIDRTGVSVGDIVNVYIEHATLTHLMGTPLHLLPQNQHESIHNLAQQ